MNNLQGERAMSDISPSLTPSCFLWGTIISKTRVYLSICLRQTNWAIKSAWLEQKNLSSVANKSVPRNAIIFFFFRAKKQRLRGVLAAALNSRESPPPPSPGAHSCVVPLGGPKPLPKKALTPLLLFLATQSSCAHFRVSYKGRNLGASLLRCQIRREKKVFRELIRRRSLNTKIYTGWLD